MRIRKATSGDLVQMKQILVLNKLSPDGIEQQIEHFLVAESDSPVVGTAGLERFDTTGLLRSVAVLPEHQNSGIGNRLVTAILRYAKQLELLEVVLFTETAATFFERRGFQRVDRSQITGAVRSSNQFTIACPASATAMRKHLR